MFFRENALCWNTSGSLWRVCRNWRSGIKEKITVKKRIEAGRAVSQLPVMTQRSPFRYFKTSPEIIRLTVMLYVRFPLSLRNVEDLLHERGIDVSQEAVRYWWRRFGLMFADELK